MIGQVLIKSGLTHDIAKVDACLSRSDNKKGNLRFGFGYGGPCFPRDNRSFSNYMDKIGMTHHYADLTDEFNQEHINFLTDYFIDTNVNGHDFYFPYISYKPGVRIFEESHQLAVCQNLLSKGARVFVEPTEFVDLDLQKELETKWGDQIQFVSLVDLEKSNHPLYKVNL
jgi:UDP-glucose 6-dehydrogenase